MSGSGSAASAIKRGSGSTSVSSIAPSFLADQWNEAHRTKVRLLQRSVLCLGDPYQLLDPPRVADGHHNGSPRRELVDQRLGHVAPARRSEDRVVRRIFGPAASPVTFD